MNRDGSMSWKAPSIRSGLQVFHTHDAKAFMRFLTGSSPRLTRVNLLLLVQNMKEADQTYILLATQALKCFQFNAESRPH